MSLARFRYWHGRAVGYFNSNPDAARQAGGAAARQAQTAHVDAITKFVSGIR